jgi:hypothetical protein
MIDNRNPDQQNKTNLMLMGAAIGALAAIGIVLWAPWNDTQRAPGTTIGSSTARPGAPATPATPATPAPSR